MPMGRIKLVTFSFESISERLRTRGSLVSVKGLALKIRETQPAPDR